MSLPREFMFNEALSKMDTTVLGTSAPVQSAPLSCSIDLPTDTVDFAEGRLSPELGGSMLSVQSAPPEQCERPHSLMLELPLATQVGAYLSALSPPEQEEDSLLTLSSVAARPLIAASRRLRDPQPSASTTTPQTDGGYGWVVVFGAFMVQFWVAGLFKSYGVLYVEIMETFPDSSESVASWIPAVLSTLCLALAPVSSALCEKYSCRLVVFVGGLFCATGLALSFFSTGLLHLLLSFGVMTGIGGGLSTTPGIVIVSQYFDKHRAMANGICVSGTAAGSFVFPMAIEALVRAYGLHGTVLLLGGGMLHVCVAATLYRDPPAHPDPSLTPGTTTTENTILLPDLHEVKAQAGQNNRLEKLFFPESELMMNQRNQLAADEKRAGLLAEIIQPSFVEMARPPMPQAVSDSEDSEGLDVLGVAGLPREVAKLRLRPTRSSSILHSVEDLSTDSTCVYKASRRKISRSLYIKPPLPRALIQSKLIHEAAREKQEQKIREEEEEVVVKKTCVERISRYLDVSLLKSWRFGLLCASVALMSCGSPYALYYLPAYTVSMGHSKANAGRLVAISAVLDLCGRLGLGWLCDLHLFCRRKAYIISILVAGLSVLTLPLLSSWWALAIAAGSYGLCLGCWFLLVPVLLADSFGTARIASSYGLVRLFQSSAAISVPPVAGLVRDVTGGYSWCFYGMGSCMVLGTIPVIAFHICSKKEEEENSSAD
ncbi:monocarboxylate transporter 12 isoform X2 [Plutella xylostella]|uniref:monocarboxylate transporter 12 isoform X1 n=1 Tax=Plutella xylostella TaxID=51655 RepID=UPI002032F9B2|nr:monocarboxylate transporter 12 isoform X1 [Plutella xylostella]XP_048480060.1 monocarboxylate transporter 12 isoform X2 [Plutella xylostella]